MSQRRHQRRHQRNHGLQAAELRALAEAMQQPLSAADQPTATRPLHLLFVCSRNHWRSPTAEQLWRNHPDVRTRSAGTRSSARHRLNAEDVLWADLILVMEEKHKAEIKAAFADPLRGKRVEVLNIPDEYHYMDPELVALLTQVVPPLLKRSD